MRYGRIETPEGRVADARFTDGVVEVNGDSWKVEDVRVLVPLQPGKLIFVGMNYTDHAAELGVDLPEEPLLFFKPNSALIGPDEPIVHPRESARVDYEGELAIVIGRTCRHVGPDEVADVIAGYTIANDVTARDFQRPGTQWTKAKAWDTFAPIGPWISTDVDPADALVETYVNGELRQGASTANLYFGVPELVAFASRIMTLNPGDVIATGTPFGVGPVRPGDEVEVRIDGIGRLRNPVVADGQPT